MIKENEKVYLSGPMSGIAGFNYPLFDKAELLLSRQHPSCVVLNPARHPVGLDYDTYMEYAMVDVKNSHVVVLLDGWENSNGAQKERAEAVKLGKRIIRGEIEGTKIKLFSNNQNEINNEQ